MRITPLLAALPLAHAINIVSSNDDGWAEINIRSLYNSLTVAGHSVVVSAPAENQSGSGSKDEAPTNLAKACEFNSCPSGSPAIGHNSSQPHLNWVNSYPVTSMKTGINSIARNIFSGAPDLAVSGPNVGSNIGLEVYFSGTAGAATYAAKNGIPAIAFSGASGSQTGWDEETPLYSQVYADLATKITDKVIAAGTPYLPSGIWLNVNFPSVSDSSCSTVDDFKFVLSRIHTAVFADEDVETCGSKRLPTETKVILTSGCYASISVGVAESKNDANATMQGVVLKKLGNFLTCLD